MFHKPTEQTGLLSNSSKKTPTYTPKTHIGLNDKATLNYMKKISQIEAKLRIINLLIEDLENKNKDYRPDQTTGFYLENMKQANGLIAKLSLGDSFKKEIFPIPTGFYKKHYDGLDIVFENLIGRIADYHIFGDYDKNCDLLEKLKFLYLSNLNSIKKNYSEELEEIKKAINLLIDAKDVQIKSLKPF